MLLLVIDENDDDSFRLRRLPWSCCCCCCCCFCVNCCLDFSPYDFSRRTTVNSRWRRFLHCSTPPLLQLPSIANGCRSCSPAASSQLVFIAPEPSKGQSSYVYTRKGPEKAEAERMLINLQRNTPKTTALSMDLLVWAVLNSAAITSDLSSLRSMVPRMPPWLRWCVQRLFTHSIHRNWV